MGQKKAPDPLETSKQRRPRSNARPGLWRGLWAWLHDGRLLGFLLALGSAVALVGLFFHPAFQVTQVLVEGNRVIPDEEARSHSEALGKNIFLLDTLAISRQLTEIPYIDRIQVERMLPARVRLRIWENFPSVSWWTLRGSERYLIDDSGLVLGLEQENTPGLIYITDLGTATVVIGDHVDAEAVQTAQQVFSRLHDDLGISLTSFEYQAGRGITAVSTDGWRACFGSSDRLEDKVRNLISLLYSGIEFSWVDLRLPERMVYH